MTRYLVTGGLGFLGQYIVRELLDHDQEGTVRIVSRSRKKTLLGVEDDPRVEFIPSDLTTEKDFSYLEDVDHVIHNAALVSIMGSEEELYRVNVEGTRNIVRYASSAPWKV